MELHKALWTLYRNDMTNVFKVVLKMALICQHTLGNRFKHFTDNSQKILSQPVVNVDG